MTAPIRVALAMLALASLAAAAGAAPQDELNALFPPGEPMCYAARFDPTQLGAHPDQTVVAIKVMRGFPNLRLTDQTATDGDAPGPSAQLIVTFRDAGQNGTPKQFGAQVTCRADDTAVRCGIACDGGDFVATRKADGALDFAIAADRTLRIAGGCTNHRQDRALGDRAGDRNFTLARRPMETCR